MRFIFIMGASFLFLINNAAAVGNCTAMVKCTFGQALCSTNSGNSGNPQERSEAFCGLKNSKDKFLTCWGENLLTKEVFVRSAICCDSVGNAIHMGWSVDSKLDTSRCVAYSKP